jgi:integrase
MLLADWIAVWQPPYEASLKPSAAHSEPSRIANHILPLLGHLTLEELESPLTVQAWIAQLLTGKGSMANEKRKRRKLSPKTVHNCHGLLYAIMQAAVVGRLIRSNPCVSTKLPKRTHREMRFLTEPEIGRLLAALPEHWRPLVLLLVATGMRWGEAVGLQVGQVDLLAKVPLLRVIRAMHEMPTTAEIIFTEPKTERSRRTVTFTKKVADALVPLWSARPRDALLFVAPGGGPVRTRNFRRVWKTALKKAGIEGLRVHDLRHTHAAILISAGRPLTAIQHRLGHSSIAVTSDLYGHLMPNVDEGILLAVEEALAGVDLESLATEVDGELVGSE